MTSRDRVSFVCSYHSMQLHSCAKINFLSWSPDPFCYGSLLVKVAAIVSQGTFVILISIGFDNFGDHVLPLYATTLLIMVI